MKKIIALAIAALISLSILPQASAQFSKLKFGSYKIESVSPTSFTSLDGVVSLVVDNTGRRFTVSNISGIAYSNGTPFVIGTAEDFTVPAGSSVLKLKGHAGLQSMSALFALIANPTINPANYTVDIKCDITQRRKTRTVEVKGLPLSAILGAAK